MRPDLFEIFCLTAEEVVASLTEALENLLVALLWCEPYGFPLLLNGDNLFRVSLPVGGVLVVFFRHGFRLLAQFCLLCEVLLLIGSEFLEVVLVLLVDDGARVLEPCPDVLAHILCHGTNLSILLVQVLQLVESAHHVRLVGQFLSFLTELCLGFEVFLEVIFASLTVEVEQVVELLNVELIVSPRLA